MRLLTFLVEERIAGPSEPLKEYRIALDVFGRPESFDPRSDSIVRIAARELRFKLREYYDTEGREDPIGIELPKGSYLPEFTLRKPASPAPPRRRRRLFLLWAGCGALALLGAAFLATRNVPAGRTTTVAVLPFETLSVAPEDNYLCQGLVDELTTALANVDGLRVVARTSATRLKEAADLLAEARRVRLDAVIEGSVRKAGKQYRITAQLINTADGLHRWSRTFVEDVDGIPAVTEAVARDVAQALRPGGRRRAAHSGDSTDNEARKLYWRGRYLRRQRGSEALAQSVEVFRSAVERDPRYPAAWAALAEAHHTAAFHQVGDLAVAEHVRKAREAAQRALALNPDSAEAYATLAGLSFFHEWDWPAAERNFRRALDLNPSSIKARYWYALGLTTQGRLEEALAQSRQARDLDPLSFTVSNDLGIILYCARRYDEAIQSAKEVLSTDPTYYPAHALLGCCHSAKGAYAQAIREFEDGLRGGERHSYLVGRLGHAQAAAGHPEEARKLLQELLQRVDSPSLSWVHLAYIYVGLNDKERALEALEKAVQRRDGDASFLAVEPLFDPLHGEPRFSALAARLHAGR